MASNMKKWSQQNRRIGGVTKRDNMSLSNTMSTDCYIYVTIISVLWTHCHIKGLISGGEAKIGSMILSPWQLHLHIGILPT